MTYANIPAIASGLVLFAVAYYSLRLNRFIGTPRVGWALAGGLSLFAILSLLPATGLSGTAPSSTANILQTLASLAVVIGLVHVEKVLSEHVRGRKAEEEARKTEEEKRTEATSLLQNKIADLTKANDQWPKTYAELQRAAATFQAEVAAFQAEAVEQKRIATELAEANKKMALAHEEESRRSSAALQARVTELERSRAEQERMCTEQVKLRAEQERSISQQVLLRAEMEKTCKQLADALAASAAAEANTTILQSVRTLLHDATASVDNVVGHAARFRSTNTSHITKLLRPTAKKPGSRTPVNGQGKRLPGSVAVLSRQLTREQSALVEQIGSLKKKIERIQKIAGSETLNGSHVLQCASTDTATAIASGDAHDTTRCTRDEVNGADVDHNDHPVLN